MNISSNSRTEPDWKQWPVNVRIKFSTASTCAGCNWNGFFFFSQGNILIIIKYIRLNSNNQDIASAVWWPILSIRIGTFFLYWIERSVNWFRSRALEKTYSCAKNPSLPPIPLHSAAWFNSLVHNWVVASKTSWNSGFSSAPSLNAFWKRTIFYLNECRFSFPQLIVRILNGKIDPSKIGANVYIIQNTWYVS